MICVIPPFRCDIQSDIQKTPNIPQTLESVNSPSPRQPVAQIRIEQIKPPKPSPNTFHCIKYPRIDTDTRRLPVKRAPESASTAEIRTDPHHRKIKKGRHLNKSSNFQGRRGDGGGRMWRTDSGCQKEA